MILAAWYHTVTALFFAVLALLLMIVVLLQRGKGVGLAGAFGGAGSGAAFGAKTGDLLTWVTVVTAVVMLAYAVVLNFVFHPTGPGLGGGTPPPPPIQQPIGTGASGAQPTGAPAPTPPATGRPAPMPQPTDTPAPAPAPTGGAAPAEQPAGESPTEGAWRGAEPAMNVPCAALSVFGAEIA